jgi:hypothetical protein
MNKPGEYVAIEFSSTDATTAALVTLKDANQATRTLAANERLLIDDLFADLATAVTSADMFSDTANTGTVDAGELIASFNPTSGEFEGGPEGYSIPVGVTPKVKAAVAGKVAISGVGRIVKGKSEGTRPSWRESQVPGK